MKEKDFIHAIDSFQLDDNLKYQVKRKVELNMKKSQNQKSVWNEERKPRKMRKVAIFSACLVAVMSISVMPIMADNTSLLESLMAKVQVKDANIQDYSKPIETTVNVDSNSDLSFEPVQLNENQDVMSVYVNDYYCDGETLVITWGIQGNDEALSRCNHICGNMELKINGEVLDYGEKCTEIFYGGSNESGQYVGQINVDVSNVENIEGARVDVDFSNFQATDLINYNFNYKTLSYEQFDTDVYNDTISFGFNIYKTNEPDYYEVNQTEGDLTVNSVTISPAFTQIDVNVNGEYFVLIHDNLGNKLAWESSVNQDTYATPNIEATSLDIAIYDMEEKNKVIPTPSYVVNVPIKCGYDIESDNDEYVKKLNPPIEEIKPLLKESAENSFKNIDSLGTPNNTVWNSDTIEYEGDGNYTMTVNSFEYLDSLDGFNVMNDRNIDENGMVKEGYKAMAIDVTVTNNLDVATTKFLSQFGIGTGTILDDYFFVESGGFSIGSDYSMDFAPNETKNYKICYIISDEITDMPLMCNYLDYSVRLQ